MAEDITALIAELNKRIDACDQMTAWNLMDQAKFALEAQAQRITELTERLAASNRTLAKTIRLADDRAGERDALAAQIAEARAAIGPENAWDGHARADQLDSTRRILSAPASDVLTAHDRRVRAEGWDEGAKWGAVEISGNERFATEAWLTPGDNPYRAEADRAEHTNT